MTTALHPTPSSGQLAPGAVLSLRIARPGVQLSVTQGRLWVTLQGEPDDHFITAGHTLALPRGARLLLECDSAEPAVWALALPNTAASAAPQVPDNRTHEHARNAPPQPVFSRRPQLR
jgi:quercetin dioxygenase-like cupin family protein